MANLDGFDANTVDPNVGFDPIPAADYLCIMIDSEFKPTKKGDGEYLQCTWEVLEGEYKKRLLFDRLNLKNANETAVKIASGNLSAICRAVGVMRPKDSGELHNKPVLIKVAIEERNDKPGSFSNVVKGYEAVNSKDKKEKTNNNIPPWKK